MQPDRHPMPTDHCAPLVDDGTVIATVHGQHPMSVEAQEAMRALIRAAVAHHEALQQEGPNDVPSADANVHL